MSRGNYYFNRETLRYERVRTDFRKRIKTALLYFLVVGSLLVTGRYLADDYFDSPKYRYFRKVNSELRSSYQSLNEKVAMAEKVLGDIQMRDDQLYRSVFDLDPIPSSVREAGFGGSENFSINLESRSSSLVTSTARKIEQLSTKARIQSTSLSSLYKKAKEQQELINNKPSIQPISPGDHVWLTSTYGYRTDPFHKTRRMHHGIDLAGQIGIKIYATGSGRVSAAGFNSHGYGNEVIIDHGFGYESIYAHLDEVFVKPGDEIIRGQLLGTLGNTGRSTGPHLHYEIRMNNKAVNPMYYYYENLTASEYFLITSISKE